MQFVKDTFESVAKFLKSEDIEIALAVAFWGGDAMKRLGIAEWKAKNVRMICNATSGACNPLALNELRSHIGSNLRTNPNLHAKVYWTPSTLVITSANASASSLSLEGEEVKGNIEAGIVSTDHLLLTEVKQWFDELYDSHKTVEVDKNIIKKALAPAGSRGGPRSNRAFRSWGSGLSEPPEPAPLPAAKDASQAPAPQETNRKQSALIPKSSAHETHHRFVTKVNHLRSAKARIFSANC